MPFDSAAISWPARGASESECLKPASIATCSSPGWRACASRRSCAAASVTVTLGGVMSASSSPSAWCSSPVEYISFTMSQPPWNSPPM